MSEKASLPFDLPPPKSGAVDLLIVAGEHSGDEHAARVVCELNVTHPGLKISALGGPGLASAGAQLLHDLTATSVVGFVEVLKHYSFFKALFEATVRWVEQYQPKAICFIDYPGFNLRLAARLRERGLSVKSGGKVKLLFYISPQIWAWKAKRRFTMARDLDALAVIFPFEPACYKDTALPVEFVGHPFLAPGYVPPVCYDPAGPVLLLPGSRVQAVGRIFPLLLAGFAEFGRTTPAARAEVLFPSEEVAAVARAELARWPQLAGRVELRPVDAEKGGGSFGTCAVLTSSGTMSLHCALAGIPGAIAYRTNAITYLLARWWVKIEYIGIANLLLKEAMYPEFIQSAATPASLAAQLRECIANPERRDRTMDQAKHLKNLLGRPTGGTAAEWVVRKMGES